MFRVRQRGLALTVYLVLVGARAFGQSHESADPLKPFVDAGTVAGAVTLVADRAGILDIDTIGWSNIASQRPMQEDSFFWIASTSKAILGTAVMMLVEEGKIDLDAPIEKYLPEFKGQWLIVETDDKHQLLQHPPRLVTVRDTLSHVSGMPHRTQVEYPALDNLPLETAVRSYAVHPLTFAPGTSYLYSNCGINTAARVLEVVSGKSYEQFLQERLLDPLQMAETTFWPSEEQVQKLATAYQTGPDKKGLVEMQTAQLSYPLTDKVHRYAMPGGGLFSTASDVARFARMILNDGELDGVRYLKPESVKEMTRRQTAESLPKSYGLGWNVSGNNCGHGGALSTAMDLDRDRGLVLIYMVQHQNYPDNGKDASAAFRKAAIEKFGKPKL